MNITFYSFAKKANSTKQPPANSGTVLSCQLKADTDMLNPTLVINNTPIGWNPIWNYCYIPNFKRYYFINSWTWLNGVWECSCAVDALASWKTDIGNSVQYILRTDSNTFFDEMITDTEYPTKNNFINQETVIPGTWAASISQGVYILGIISAEDTGAVGAISYYAMTSSQFGDLKDMLFSDQNLITMGLAALDPGSGQLMPLVTDMSMEVLKTMYNPFQYIVSCIWLPLSISDFTHGSLETSLKIGWWTYSLQNYPVFAQQISLLNVEQTIIPAHPDAATRGAYLNYAPYTRITVYGRFGTIALDTSKFKAGWKLNFAYYIDLITSQCRVEISAWDPALQTPTEVTIAERNFVLGVPIQLSQVGVDYMGAAVAAVNGAANTLSAATHLDIGGVISSAANGIYNTIKSTMPIVETSGANGSFLVPYKSTKVCYQFFQLVGEDLAHRGRPVCATVLINTLSGYILCADGELDLDCFAPERQMISAFLTGGFFWE